MNMAEYLTALKDTLNKINRQSYTEIKMIENKAPEDFNKKEIGSTEEETLNKAKSALNAVMEILGRI